MAAFATAVNYSKSTAAAEELVVQISKNGGQARAIQADVTNEKQVSQMIEATVEALGCLTQPHPTVELSGADWDQCLDLNCKSVFLCVKHAIPHLRRGTGRIIVNSSISARTGAGPGMLAYAAAKGAINNMVRNWAKELTPRGITVNAIAPGVIRTRLHERMTPPEEYRKLIERIPLRRDGLPEDCVGAVLLLASDAGSYITGQVLEINGGMSTP